MAVYVCLSVPHISPSALYAENLYVSSWAYGNASYIEKMSKSLLWGSYEGTYVDFFS